MLKIVYKVTIHDSGGFGGCKSFLARSGFEQIIDFKPLTL